MQDNLKGKTFKYQARFSVTDFFVDIIIPFRDENSRVIELLQSIFEKVKKPRCEIYLVDDASKNKSFITNFTKTTGVHLIQFDRPVGFGAAVNEGIRQSKSSVACVMHSDTKVVEPNFLWNLCNDFYKLRNENIATICSVTNNPMNSRLKFLQKNQSAELPPEKFTDTNSPFICTLINKQIFNILGGLPEYPLCWYEHELFGDKCRKAGFSQFYSNSSFVYHEGGSTITKLVNENNSYMELLKNNLKVYEQDRKKFLVS